MTATPFDTVAQARAIAAPAGLRITDKADAGRRIFRVFRLAGPRAIYLGRRTSAAGLLTFIQRLACA